MKKLLSIAIIAAAVLSSCSKTENSSKAPVFRASIEDVATRTSLDPSGDGYNLVWTAGDIISVSNGSKSVLYSAATGGSTSTEFNIIGSEPFSGDLFTAYYPATLAEGILPEVQTYAGNNVVEAPMMAVSTDPNTIDFRLLCGMIKISISTPDNGTKVSSIVLSSDQGFSGECMIDGNYAALSGRGKDVSLNCGEGVAIGPEAVPFLISVPADRYTGLVIKIITTDGRQAVVKLASDDSYTVKRAEVREIGISVGSFEKFTREGEALLMMGTDFNEILKQFNKSTAKAIDSDNSVKKIIFRTNDPTVSDKKVSYFNSEVPIYASWDAATGTVTVTTAASEIMANESLSFTFGYLHALESIEGLTCLNTSRTKFFDRMFIMSGRFSPKLEEIDCSGFNTENAISFQAMFDSCLNAKKIDVSSFNTANAESFTNMFNACYSVEKLDVSNFNTAKANRMAYMFNRCQSLEELDVSNFNTSNVTTMAFMFTHCEKVKVLDVSKFDTENVTTMDNMFSDCWAVEELDLRNFNTDKVTDTRSMFNRCKSVKTLDLSHMTFPQTGRMTYMFYQMEKLETLHIEGMDMSRWQTASNLIHMFRYQPCLKDIYMGAKGYNSSNLNPTSFFTDAADGLGKRTGSYSGGFTIHCCRDAVSWLPKTSLRWIASGHNGQTKIPVKFVDYITGEEYTPTWPAN